MTIKFSQFLNGAVPRTTDIVVGLRDFSTTPLNERFNFTGVADTDGNNIVSWSSTGALAVNYLDFKNSLTTLGPTIAAVGTDAAINLNIGGKDNSSYTQFLGTRAIAVPAGTTAEELTGIVGGLRYDTDTDYLRYWDIGANAWVDIIAGAAYDDATYVTNTDETANLPNSQPLSLLSTGIMYVTTTTGIISSIVTANNAVMVTNSSGIPSFTASMTDGQLLIGQTGSAPAPNSLTAGANITITPGAGTIEIAAAAGGDVDSVTGTANEIDVDNTDPNNPILSLSSTLVAPGSLAVTALTASQMVATNASKELVSVAFDPADLPYVVLQDGSPIYGADAGGTDAYAITLSPAPVSYTTGMVINFKANTANTGAATLNVNTLGAITIKKLNDQDLETGDIEAGQIVTVIYDGTNFQMQSQIAVNAPGDAGRLLNIQILPYNGGGAETYTKTAGTNTIYVEAQAAGGAGGGTTSGGSGEASSAGGGAGGFAAETIDVSATSTLSYQIGANGAGASGGNGGNAASTTFDGITCGGGAGGALSGRTTANSYVAGGAGGAASGGDLNIDGGDGNYGKVAAGGTIPTGFGGRSQLGAGGVGAPLNANGQSGSGYGSGGGGVASSTAADFAGGDGAPGIITVWEYS